MKRRVFLASLPMVGLVGCAAEPVWAPEAAVARAFAPQVGAPSLTLYTMLNVGSDNGAHTGLLINANQRVLWDPAGTFKADALPERNDVIYGATPLVEQYYASFHARETYYVVAQKVTVSQDVAERTLRAVEAYGAVRKAHCARATSTILRGIPGFETLRRTYSPSNLAQDFGMLPGVESWEIREDDADDKTGAGAQINQLLSET